MWWIKFKLLCWKNWIMIKRHYIMSALEIFFPVAIMLLLLKLHTDNNNRRVVKGKKYEAFDVMPPKCTYDDDPLEFLVYTPENDVTTNLIKKIEENFNFSTNGFETESGMDNWIREISENRSAVAIVFDESFMSSNFTHLSYEIKFSPKQYVYWLTEEHLENSKRSRIYNDKYPTHPEYFESCFLAIQNAIDKAFINNEKAPSLKLKAFPYPDVGHSSIMQLRNIFSFLFVCSVILPLYKVISNISIEREYGLKESIKMVGLSSGVYWSSWFFRDFIMLIIPLTVNCILVSLKLFTTSGMFIIWIFWAVYSISVITYGFMISVMFKKPAIATIVGSLLFFLTAIIIFVSIDQKFSALSYFSKLLFCILINTNLGVGVNLITNSELYGNGMHITNIFDRDIKMQFSFGELLLFMLLGSLLQLLITLYIERVFPGDFGIAEPFYFPLRCLKRKVNKSMSAHDMINGLDHGHVSTDYEPEPRNLRTGIEICNIKKKFGAKTAVNNLSLKMFENQITVLLGHNGAGKTTTMSMLVGLFSPTSGTAYLDGKDIRTEVEEARRSVGICPQHDILFHDLTVEEHLIFYCTLKGMTDINLINHEVRRYTDLLSLTDKLHQNSQTLSGGMQRKLSIAIALCANTKIVILDEPSSGMDPGARRELWNVLIAEKKGRTILLSTHFLDEADVLGDRIAIMSDGTLRTVGSSFFLKQKFGTGYRIICEKSRGFNSRNVLTVLKEFASDARVESEGDTEITFVVDERKLPIFDKMLKALEDKSKDLKIPSFGCNLSSLEDVFIRLGSEAVIEKPTEKSPLIPRNDQNVTIYLRSTPNATGTKLIFYQIEAIILKKLYVFLRSWKSLLGMMIFSILLLYFNSVNEELIFGTRSEGKLNISLATNYEKTITLIEGNTTIGNTYKNIFHGKDEFKVIYQNIEDYVLKISNKSILTFNKKHVIGATFKKGSILAWFNSQYYHSMPLAINTVNRAILKAFKGPNYDIVTYNNPYVYVEERNNDTDAENYYNARVDDVNLMLLTMEVFILILYWPLIFTTHYFTERETNVKLMQFISGMNRCVYWITSFFFDFIAFFIIWCFLYGYVMLVGTDSVKFNNICLFMLLTMSYAFSMLPFSYLCSFIFKKTSSFLGAFTGFLFIAVISSLIITPITLKLASFTEEGSEKYLFEIAHWIGLAIPPYSIVTEFYLTDFHLLSYRSDSEALFNFESGGIGRCLLLNLLSGLFYLILCLLLDYNVFVKIYYNFLERPRELNDPSANLDIDVRAEMEKIRQMSQNDINSRNLILRRLTKFYKNFLAVNQLFLEVQPRECFGLLGINGAGKSTAFKMMTGDILLSGGDVNIRGHSIKSHTSEIYKEIGYCPQFDGLLPELTGAEILRFFALIRGIDKILIQEIIELTARDLGFEKHLFKPTKTFSGGNRRKLSCSLALLGDPQIIFLDEPTTGIDPQARRMVWNAINKAREAGRTVILTSHSMDECEALCTRVGIMAKGEFKCLGSIQYLKNKFSKGYVLTIKMGIDDASLMNEIKLRVQATFGQSTVFKERYLNILTFHISHTNLKWSEMFKSLARMKEELDISEYALTQMTLEQVFLLLTKEK